eukprot:403338275
MNLPAVQLQGRQDQGQTFFPEISKNSSGLENQEQLRTILQDQKEYIDTTLKDQSQIENEKSTDTLLQKSQDSPTQHLTKVNLNSLRKKHQIFDYTRIQSRELIQKISNNSLNYNQKQLYQQASIDSDINNRDIMINKDQIQVQVKSQMKMFQGNEYNSSYKQSKIGQNQNQFMEKLTRNSMYQSLSGFEKKQAGINVVRQQKVMPDQRRNLYKSIDLGKMGNNTSFKQNGEDILRMNQQNSSINNSMTLNQSHFKTMQKNISPAHEKELLGQSQSNIQIEMKQTSFNPNKYSQMKNYNSLSQAQLIKIIEQQNLDLKSMKDQLTQFEDKIKRLRDKKKDYEQTNKELLHEIMGNDFEQDSQNQGDNQGNSPDNKQTKSQAFSSPGKIHKIYQDFFITDMKRDLDKAMNLMSTQKSNANTALLKLSEIKKENDDLKLKLQRYRKLMNDTLKQNNTQSTVPDPKSKVESSSNLKSSLSKLDQDSERNDKLGDINLQSIANLTKLALTSSLRRLSISPNKGNSRRQGINLNGIVQDMVDKQGIDKDKLQIFSQSLRKLTDCLDFYSVIECVTASLRKLINCHRVSFLLFDSDWIQVEAKNSANKFSAYKFAVDGETFQQVALQEKDISEPAFINIKEFGQSNEIYKRKDFVCAIMPNPIDPKKSENQNKIAALSNTDQYFQKPFGCIQMSFIRPSGMNGQVQLSFSEEIFMKSYACIMGEKIRKIYTDIISERRKKEIIELVKLSSVICSQKTYSNLIVIYYVFNYVQIKLRETLSSFFGFETAGILLKDENTPELFTSVNTNPDPIFDRQEDFVSYPSTVGLTGFVVKSKQIFLCNAVQKELRFNSATDNISSVSEPFNIMICPIIDLKDDIDTLKIDRIPKYKKQQINEKVSVMVQKKKKSQVLKDGQEPKVKDNLLGIIQLVNKSDKSNINDFDIEKYWQINQLLVTAIRIVKDIRVFLNFTMAQQTSLSNQNEMFKQVTNIISKEQTEVMSNLSSAVFGMKRHLRQRMNNSTTGGAGFTHQNSITVGGGEQIEGNEKVQ